MVALLVVVALIVPVSAPATAVAPAGPGPVLAKALGLDTDAAVTADTSITLQADSAADAVALPPSPAADTLAQGDSDLFSIDLDEGERIELSLAAPSPAGAVFDLYLYAPGLDTLEDAIAIAHASEGPFPRTVSYVVPTGADGTYYVEVVAWQGAADYELTWQLRPASENQRIDVGDATPLALPANSHISLPDAWGANRLFAINLTASRRVEIYLAGPAGADFDIHLYAPGTASILPLDTKTVRSATMPHSNEHIIFDVPADMGGTYYLEFYRFNGGGDANYTVVQKAIPSAPTAERVSGADRYATASAISRKAFPAGSQTAVLVSGEAFPDGLSASSLAGALNAPVLLTQSRTLPAATKRELERLGVRRVYIVGGTAAVSADVGRAVLAMRVGGRAVAMERVEGRDRYATAALVALKTRQITGRNPDTVFIASGENFPDGLALSPVAYTTSNPILLASRDALPAPTANVIPTLRGAASNRMNVVVAGGTAAISAPVAARAATLARGTLTRAQGPTRFETSLAIAEHAVTKGWCDPATLAFASGMAFPDALAGAPLPGMRGGPMLFTMPDSLSPPIRLYMTSFDFALNEAWLLGGNAAVSPQVLTAIHARLPQRPLVY